MAGKVTVDVRAESMFLRGNLPVEVRDANHVVVFRGPAGSSVDLPEGIYAVSAINPDGRPSTQLVVVEDDKDTAVVFDAPVPEPPPPANDVYLKDLDGCEVGEQTDSSWVFTPLDSIHKVPTATFGMVGRSCTMSLPLNPAGEFPLDSCSVVATAPDGQPKLRMSFAPQRRVATMVDGLLQAHTIGTGVKILDDASRLLFEKYSDPPAAVLAGLTLQRMGVLSTRRAWVENLARSFPWLPDGSILLAALLRGDPDVEERQRGLELLLSATENRPLYTDGLALAVELLRRWPDKSSQPARHDRLDRLAAFSVAADLDAINLTVLS